MSILDLSPSNAEIIKLINKNVPFSIARLGMGPETMITHEYLLSGKINTKYLHPHLLTLYNAGIYTKNRNLDKIKEFCILYNDAIKNADLLASFKNGFISQIQNHFSHKYNLKQIHSRSLEPFYSLIENEKPWTHYLKDKKILIINPFVESFQKQLNNGFQIFKDKKVFLDGQQFVFYKSYQTIAGNRSHPAGSGWPSRRLVVEVLKDLLLDEQHKKGAIPVRWWTRREQPQIVHFDLRGWPP